MSQIRLRVLWDGQQYDGITAITADQVRYERVARQQKWPMPQSEELWPITYLVFLAWSAMKREGRIPAETTWEHFSEHVEDVESDNSEEVGPDPIRSAAQPASG
jgi:hypothetical protein